MPMLVEVEDLEGADGAGFDPTVTDGPDDCADDNGKEL